MPNHGWSPPFCLHAGSATVAREFNTRIDRQSEDDSTDLKGTGEKQMPDARSTPFYGRSRPAPTLLIFRR
jgi:hypothetical protein